MLKEFKPAFFFLFKFLGIYLVGNILYGFYVESYGDKPDAATMSVTAQTGEVLRWCGESITLREHPGRPTVSLEESGHRVVSVYEGCNGVNVMIVFLAFMIAFGGPLKSLVGFSIVGLLIIHLANIGRIFLLYFTAQLYRQYFYYMHKYFFTAILYVIVLALWAVWVYYFNIRHHANVGAKK